MDTSGKFGRFCIATVAALSLAGLACGSDDDSSATTQQASSEAPAETEASADTKAPADDIHGTWYWAEYDAYETLGADGEWSVREGLATVHAGGTYTFEDGVLTFFDADDSLFCPGDVAVFEVAFSENGDELQQSFVSDTCDSVRGQDRVLVRDTP